MFMTLKYNLPNNVERGVHSDTHTLTDTHYSCLNYSQSAHTDTLTQSVTHSLTLSLTHSHTNTLCLIHSHPLSLIHSHTLITLV